MRTLLFFIGGAAIVMGILGMIAQSPTIAYFGLIGMGAIALVLGFLSPEEM